MDNGLYLLRFMNSSGAGGGAGVVTYQDGAIGGGDSMFYYWGLVGIDGSMNATGKMSVRQHSGDSNRVFSGLKNFELNVTGQQVGPNALQVIGSTPDAPGQSVTIMMTNLQDAVNGSSGM